MKEEGDDRYKQINETIASMENKISDIDEKCEHRKDELNRSHDDQSQGKAVVTGFHSETSESEAEQLLKETIIEIGMSIVNARIECSAANMLRKELRGRKLKITPSMDAEERFRQKRMGYVKYCIHMRHDIPFNSISLNWTLKYVSMARFY